MAEQVRIQIAFEGGESLSALVDPSVADELERALREGRSDPVGVEAEDGHYTVVLSRVAWMKRTHRESRVGFAGG